MEESNLQEKVIYANELGGEPFNINLAEVEELEGQFVKEVVDSPDDYSFDNKLFKALLDGFTEGALKNFITIGTEKTRLYKITESSIKLLSCSKTPFNIGERPIEKSTLVLNKSDCSVQVFAYLSEKIPVVRPADEKPQSYILRFDFSTGALIESSEAAYPKESTLYRLFNPRNIKPKNSKIESFAIGRLNLRDPSSLSIQIGRLRKGRYTPWMKPHHFFNKRLKRDRARYAEQTKALGEEIRRNFNYDYPFDSTTAFPYTKDRPELSLIIAPGYQQYFFFLVDFRKRKILKSKSINLLDLLEANEIEAIFRDPLQGEAGQQNQTFSQWQILSRSYAYFPKSSSLFLMARLKEVEITFKIEDLFSADLRKGLKVMKRRKINEANNILRKFGDDKLLIYYSGEVRSTYSRRWLGWIWTLWRKRRSQGWRRREGAGCCSGQAVSDHTQN